MFGLDLLGMYVAAFWILTQPMGSRSRQWWVEVDTDLPKCTYYFGPYESKDEASNNTNGYIKYLEKKGTKNISINIKEGRQPSQLTARDES
ncbi:MAG: DUF1816 domain-containing protein [Microcoleus sp.]